MKVSQYILTESTQQTEKAFISEVLNKKQTIRITPKQTMWDIKIKYYQAIFARNPLGYVLTAHFLASSMNKMAKPNVMGKK